MDFAGKFSWGLLAPGESAAGVMFLLKLLSSSWYKIVENINKNQPFRRYKYFFYATLCIIKNK